MDPNEIRNVYFKDRPDGIVLMSGMPLPKDADGAVRGKRFVHCSFHPNCQQVAFIDCAFIGCTK